MINLIKNELIKIFNKKGIYIVGIISLLFLCLSVVIYKTDSVVEEDFTTVIEENLNNYDLNNVDELSWYVEDLSIVETNKIAFKYPKNSWQRKMIQEELSVAINCMNNAKYILKNDSSYNTCKNDYDRILSNIDSGDWTLIVKNEKEEKVNLLNDYNKMLNDSSLIESERYSINKNINILNYQIEGLDIRLSKNIAPDYSNASSIVDDYVSYAIQYLDYDKDESNYASNDELLTKRSIESEYYINKYKLDNDLYNSDNSEDSNQLMLFDFEEIVLMVLVLVILISSSIVSEEYNKGTIKQLLLRPYSRVKILMSKYLACIIVFMLFMIFYLLATSIAYGFIGGFKDYLEPVIVYNFNTSSVMEINIISMCLSYFMALLPEYLIILTIAFFVSTVFENTSVAMIVSILVYFGSSILNILIVARNIKYLSWVPSLCWDFTDYLFGGISSYKYGNLYLSLFVSIITFLMFFIGSFICFKKKDIKNI